MTFYVVRSIVIVEPTFLSAQLIRSSISPTVLRAVKFEFTAHAS